MPRKVKDNIEDFKNVLFDIVGDEYVLCDNSDYIDSKTPIEIKHNTCGHCYFVRPSHFKRGQRCPVCMRKERDFKVSKTSESKRNETLELKKKQIKLDIIGYFNDRYKFIDFYYKKDKKNRNCGCIKLKCKKCNKEFERNISLWRGKNQECPHCNGRLRVSYLHATVNEFIKKHYPNSIAEYDAGFKGNNGGISKYDLFIPNLNGKNILVEFQSRYHDIDSQKELDIRKKKYALENGYTYYAFDHRNTSVKDVINILLLQDKLNESQTYDESEYLKKDFRICQKYLYQNYTVKRIEQITGISSNIIFHKIKSGELINPPERKANVRNIKKILQLDLNGNIISEFNSSYDAYKKLGYNVWSCAAGQTKTCHGFVFIYKDDYLNNAS